MLQMEMECSARHEDTGVAACESSIVAIKNKRSFKIQALSLYIKSVEGESAKTEYIIRMYPQIYYAK